MFSWVEVSESALRYNLKQFKKKIGEDTLLMPVIKSNAYGHGFELVAKICDSDKNVSHICVVNSEEALNLINLGIHKPIIILSFYSNDKKEIKKMIDRGVIFPIYQLEQFDFLNKIAKSINKKVKVHIKIDTGTTRIGFLTNELSKVIKKIHDSRWLIINGVFSHFASSENDTAFTKKQFLTFNQALEVFKNNKINPPIKHMACTAASLNVKFKGLNAMRLGLGLYGLYPEEKLKNKINLKPALTWKTKIIQIKNLPPDTGIGYGGTYKTKKKTKIAIIPVGYWDGYDRGYSNKTKVLIKKNLCPIRGRICMNLSMVELPLNTKIKNNEEVVLLGNNKREITADFLANAIGTINYEITTRINPSVKRIKIK